MYHKFFTVNNLKPNTKHVFKVANIDRTHYCSPVSPGGPMGSLISDSAGSISFNYYPPQKSEYNNTINFELIGDNSYATITF